jgi:hypothetical protein
MADSTTLTALALNRALLSRQMLLSRESISPVRAIERLIGLQAQQPRPPFVGLWSRIEGFSRESLRSLFDNREVVRATMMRATLHVVSANDYLAFRGSIQPALSAAMKSIQQSREVMLDERKIIAAAGQCFEQRPQTFVELRAALSKIFPELDERVMGYMARTCLPLVMVPDHSEYGFAGATFTAAESWLGRPVEKEQRIEDLLLRYLAAFGPASVRDAQTWSGLPRLDPVFEALRPKLHVFRDPRGRELFDVPGALRPSEDIPAPVRFLPAFDNLILSHTDRTRVIADEYRSRVATKNLQILPTFLVDGFVAGVWDVSLQKKTATLTISPFAPISRRVRLDLATEAEKLVRFVAPGAARFEVAIRTP